MLENLVRPRMYFFTVEPMISSTSFAIENRFL